MRKVKVRGKRMSFAGRLKASMLAAGLDTKSVADKLEVTPQVVRRWLKNSTPHMSAVHLIELSVLLNVRAHWLATGEGSPQRFNPTEYTQSEFLQTYLGLTENERRILRDMASALMKYRE